MKVKELVKLLSEFDQNAEVILQKDPEGNGYSPLSGIDPDAIYVIDDGSWEGAVYSTDWTSDDACMDEDEWEDLLRKPRCVVLFP